MKISVKQLIEALCENHYKRGMLSTKKGKNLNEKVDVLLREEAVILNLLKADGIEI